MTGATRQLRLLGIAALAVSALAVSLGAGSASATVLCKEYSTPCPKGEDYEPGTKIDATLEGSTTFKVSGSTISTCTASTIEGKTSNTGSATETVSVALTTFNFGSCSSATVEVAAGQLEIHYIEVENTTTGTLTLKGSSTTVTFASISCTYGTPVATHIGTFTSDGSMTYATLDVNTTLTKQSGSFLCPSNITWEASYNVTEPEELYVKKAMKA
jgi:hypothetical protein